ncbi:Wzz/FepE/Etk N-terminal domain-containing protein, partial [Prochlorococcus sp. AH-716-I07]|nr:Wzz/FepE/Etk N-terminal domain-containing protein [Prochlorococcus sp. AH-716-I07]
MEKENNFENLNYDSFNNDEIDIKAIYRFFLRNKILISAFSFIFLLLGILYSLTLKRVWEGQFQIVLESEKKTSIGNPALQSFLTGNKSNDIQTQVEILKSPSILMPIYEFALSNSKSNENLNYKNWSNNLNIALKRGTSILNISYRDSNKELVQPVLEKMTLTYQDYSGSNKKRTEQLTRKYLNEQISLFREKSSNSLKRAQEFAIDQDLIFNKIEFTNNERSYQKGELSELKEKEDFIIEPNIAIENRRVRAANEIRQINSQLDKISSIGNDYTKLQYIGSTIPGLVSEGLPKVLSDLEKSLAQNRLIYSDDDIVIKESLEKRNFIISLLKERSIGYLNAKKMQAEAILQSTMRPKGVLLKYKELIRQAGRDEKTLVSLENQLRIFELEEAKYDDPWKLITKPTLLKNPVAPLRKNIAFLALIFGAITGSLIALFKEKSSGYIQDEDSLSRLLSVPLLETIQFKDQFFDLKEIAFFSEYLKNQISQKITFISLSKVDYANAKKLKEFLIEENKLTKKIDIV